MSGYAGARLVVLEKGAQAWTITWLAALAASAECVAFGGGTLNAIFMQRSPRRFGWQNPFSVAQALCGGFASMWLTTACGSGKSVDFPGLWIFPDECKQVFFVADCLCITLLTAWGASISARDTLSRNPAVRAIRAVVTTSLVVCGGGIIRDCVAIALGHNTPIGNFAPGVVFPVVLSSLTYHTFLMAPHRLQIAIGLPITYVIYYSLPALMTRAGFHSWA